MDAKDESLAEEAVFLFSMGEDEKAESMLKTITNRNNDSLSAHRALSEVSLSLGKLFQAEESCRQALRIKPDDLASWVSLARILVKKEDKEGAEAATAKARLLGWKEELAEDDANR